MQQFIAVVNHPRSVTGLRPRPLPPRRKSFEIWRAIPGASMRWRPRHFLLLPDWLAARALFSGSGTREEEIEKEMCVAERTQTEHARIRERLSTGRERKGAAVPSSAHE